MNHEIQVCDTHSRVLSRCRCMGPHVIKKVPCRGTCFDIELCAVTKEDGGVFFWKEPQLPLDNVDPV